MNITPHIQSLPVGTVVNPQTESLRRDNNLRQVITQPAAVSNSAAEKGVATERERSKTPGQNSDQIDFANLRKQAEQNNSVINGDSGKGGESSSEPDRQDSKNDKNQQESDKSEQNDFEAFAEEQVINSLQQRDREVRSHELAHASVGGAATGAPSYTFETGPDGKKYAVGGEVTVDLSPVKGQPRATIAKMQKVHAAALAPANPSAQDTRVAATATKIILQAQSELAALESDDQSKVKRSQNFVRASDVFNQIESTKNSQSDFDTLINQTLEAQENISPSRSLDIEQRALRIENFYSGINQAYEKPPTYQFQLTA